MSILSLKNITKSYGKEKVLRGISFELEEPKILALVGPNGAGKSTLLNIITNLIKPDQGEVTILGKSNTNPDIFRDVSFMQDNSILYEYLTGYDHLQFIGDIQSISKNKIMETAHEVGMSSYIHKKVGKYSLGMKQHLLLTMALVNNPKLLILDEPINGLDPTSAIRVREILLKLYKQGTTILLSSHNLGEIDRITSHVLFLSNGEIIEENLIDLEETFFTILVDHVDCAKDTLNSQKIEFSEANGKLIFSTNNVSLQTIITELLKVNINIIDIEKIKSGSENRYQQIFGGRDKK